jgi:hypothetical protein
MDAKNRATANKIWMLRKFFLLPGIFSLKIENHFQKISQKSFAERSRFVIGWAHEIWPTALTERAFR